MARNAIIFLFLLLNLSCTEITTDEDFAKAVVKAIQEEDVKKFTSFTVNEDDLQCIMGRLTAEEDKKQKIKEYVQYKADGWKADAEKTITEMYITAREHGMNWKTAQIESITNKIITRDNIEKTDFYVILNDGGKKYKLKIDDCIRCNRGWIIFDDLKLRTFVE